jgi:histidine ammonia-lyase
VPVAPEGSALVQTVEDMQSQTRLKVERARRAVADTVDLFAEDLLVGTFWLDVRHAENPDRHFGPAPTAAWNEFRKILPLSPDAAHRPLRSSHDLAARFIQDTKATDFYPAGLPAPGELVQARHTK